MYRVVVLVLVMVGCKEKAADADGDGSAAPAPCVVGDDVCIQFDNGWSSREAADECSAVDGSRESCPNAPIGECATDDGVTYWLYAMNPVDAAAYCEYLGGDWQLSD